MQFGSFKRSIANRQSELLFDTVQKGLYWKQTQNRLKYPFHLNTQTGKHQSKFFG